jgi:hypothetical protein
VGKLGWGTGVDTFGDTPRFPTGVTGSANCVRTETGVAGYRGGLDEMLAGDCPKSPGRTGARAGVACCGTDGVGTAADGTTDIVPNGKAPAPLVRACFS